MIMYICRLLIKSSHIEQALLYTEILYIHIYILYIHRNHIHKNKWELNF